MVYGPKIGGQASALEISDSRRFTAVYDESDLLLADQGSDTEHSLSEDWNAAARRGRWLSPEKAILPFTRDEELEEFLRTATIVSNEEIPSGINRPRKLLLEQYGIRAHAIFRHFEAEERNKRLPSGEVIPFFSDSYRNETAAYEVARLVGLDHLYPAVRREVQGRNGSVQLWVEGVVSERERLAANSHPPSIDEWLDQGSDMRVFDNLINNFDRNQGNILVDPDWKIWLIDHTRSFGREQQLPDPQYLERCSHELWNRIRALDEETVRRRLEPHLSGYEIDAFLARRARLIEALETRIAELGEQQVLFQRGRPADSGQCAWLTPTSLHPLKAHFQPSSSPPGNLPPVEYASRVVTAHSRNSTPTPAYLETPAITYRFYGTPKPESTQRDNKEKKLHSLEGHRWIGSLRHDHSVRADVGLDRRLWTLDRGSGDRGVSRDGRDCRHRRDR